MHSIDEFEKKLKMLGNWENKLSDADVVIFGAGNTAILYQNCLEMEKIYPKYFCDNNKDKQGKTFLGKEVISPFDVKKRCQNPIVLVLSAVPEICIAIKEQCDNLGLVTRMLDEIVFGNHRKEILENYMHLEDDMSKEVYEKIIMARIQGSIVPDECYSENQYFAFPAFLKRRTNEVFVDCGAYVGDSIEQYVWKKAGTFGMIYGFEPDKVNYERMQIRLRRIEEEWGFESGKITAILAGVGEETNRLFVEGKKENASSVSAKIGYTGSQQIDVFALDDYFINKKISFIKADIESYEMKMIEGATRILREDKPLLAVCIYHNATDMYSIMQKIKEINPSYKFGIRHHSVEYCETVLYAW